MADSQDLRAVGERLEQLLEGLRQAADGRVGPRSKNWCGS